ncbi:MAG: hypothetical protein ABI675_02390 [Chitinophagaceae bacterium]
MKKIYILLIGLFVAQLILAFFCGPYSCEWGNTVYFYAGVVSLLMAAMLPFLRKDWLISKRLLYGFLFLLCSVIVWVLGFMAGGFKIICRLF